MSDRSLLGYIIDTDVVSRVEQQFDDCLGPVRPVAEQSQVTQGLLGAPQLALLLAKFV